jgi:hypothetical protein
VLTWCRRQWVNDHPAEKKVILSTKNKMVSWVVWWRIKKHHQLPATRGQYFFLVGFTCSRPQKSTATTSTPLDLSVLGSRRPWSVLQQSANRRGHRFLNNHPTRQAMPLPNGRTDPLVIEHLLLNRCSPLDHPLDAPDARQLATCRRWRVAVGPTRHRSSHHRFIYL